MSRGKAAASNPFMEEESGSLEAYLEGKDEIVVDGDGKPTEQVEEVVDGDEEAGAPAKSGADAEDEDGEDEPDGDVDKLRSELRAERRRKRNLEKRLKDVEQRQQAVEAGTAQHLRAVRDQNINSTLGQIDQRVAAFESRVKAAQQARREAFESGDADKFDAADEALNTERGHLAAARQQAAAWKQRAEVARQQPVSVAAEPTPQARAGDAKSLATDWLNKNRWFVDEVESADAETAREESRMLVAIGIKPDDPRHWERLEARVKRLLPHRYAKQAANGRERNGAPMTITASQRGGGLAASGSRKSDNEISAAEAKAWMQGRGYDIINNKAQREEFLDYRKKSRAARTDPNRIF